MIVHDIRINNESKNIRWTISSVIVGFSIDSRGVKIPCVFEVAVPMLHNDILNFFFTKVIVKLPGITIFGNKAGYKILYNFRRGCKVLLNFSMGSQRFVWEKILNLPQHMLLPENSWPVCKIFRRCPDRSIFHMNHICSAGVIK